MGPGKNLHREMDIHNKWNGPINEQINDLNSFDEFYMVDKQLDIYILLWFSKWKEPKNNSKPEHDILIQTFHKRL